MDHFISDPHAFHKNIIQYSKRPFDNIYQMNTHLLDKINKQVIHNDRLWLLGDVAFGPFKNLVQFREQINCKDVHLIVGNHDESHYNKYYHDLKKLFSSVSHLKQVTINRQRFVLCHYSMFVWPKNHRGAIHLYGHSHSSVESVLDKLFPERRSIDVGVDNAIKVLGEYRPFTFDDIIKLLGKRKGYSVDHHRGERFNDSST